MMGARALSPAGRAAMIGASRAARMAAAQRRVCAVHTSSSSLLLSSLELSDKKVGEPRIRALIGTASHFCEVVVLKLRRVCAVPSLPFQDLPSYERREKPHCSCYSPA